MNFVVKPVVVEASQFDLILVTSNEIQKRLERIMIENYSRTEKFDDIEKYIDDIIGRIKEFVDYDYFEIETKNSKELKHSLITDLSGKERFIVNPLYKNYIRLLSAVLIDEMNN